MKNETCPHCSKTIKKVQPKTKTVKIGPVAIKAIDAVRTDTTTVLKRERLDHVNVTDILCMEVLGKVYLNKKFGKVMAQDIVNMAQMNTNKRWG